MINETKRREVLEAMKERSMDAALVFDSEGARNPNLVYLTGHPFDAVVLVEACGDITLYPWDLKLARKYASGCDIVDPFTEKGGARGAVLRRLKDRFGGKPFTLAFPANTAYHTVTTFQKALPQAKIVADPGGIDRILQAARATKTAEELAIMDKGFAIGDEVIALVPQWLEEQRGKTPREIDLGFFLQKEMLDRGTDGAREAMIVANADRSGQIHPHPQAGDGPLFKPGLTLFDFWMQVEGYYTDITLPILIEPLTDEQERMVEITLGVYHDTMANLVTGASIADLADKAMETFKQNGLRPVGALGHGLGLAGHDAPHLRGRPKGPVTQKGWVDQKLEEGMVLAIEPGVIHDVHGGFRLENDVVMGPERAEIKTHAEVLRFKP